MLFPERLDALPDADTAPKQRWVTRRLEEDVLNEVVQRTAANPMIMRRRQGMVEHPFGEFAVSRLPFVRTTDYPIEEYQSEFPSEENPCG